MARALFILLGYLIAVRVILSFRFLRERFFGAALLSIFNFVAIGLLFHHTGRLGFGMLLTYFGLAIGLYIIMRLFSRKSGLLFWAAFFAPILLLIEIRYFPGFWNKYIHLFKRPSDRAPTEYFVGISYLTFRLSYLAVEVRNGAAKMPNLWQYLGFAFFLPTLPVGPINPYAKFITSFETPDHSWLRAQQSLIRILVGVTKYYFLANLFNQLTYAGLLLDGHPHAQVDLVVAAIAYYFYLYLNFSGFCDMAIGAAGLIGIHVIENFNNPLAARNIKDFWNRWHISLSNYMRDVVFSPLSKSLIGIIGPKHANHAIAVSISTVFILVGIWHGIGIQFFRFGLCHAAGVVSNHYYTIFLKKALGREKFKVYNENRWIHAIAVGLTFLYISASLYFFANTPANTREIFATLRKG